MSALRRAAQALVPALALALSLAAAPAIAAGTGAGFPTPEDAATALLSALLSGESWQVEAVLGPGGAALLASGNHAIDQVMVRDFILAYADRHSFEIASAGHAVLHVGPRGWPLPVPLVEDRAGWHFDTTAAREEIADRRIGRNELGAVRGLLALSQAQRAYRDAPGGDGSFALRLVSTAGKHDGLFWPDAAGSRSPLAQAEDDALTRGRTLIPNELPYAFGGYRVKLLTAQGPHAPGGARDYLAGSALSDGYAYIAWPVAYGRTGLATFLLGPDGHVFQKDLGPATEAAATHTTSFDPDLTWSLVRIAN